MSRSSQHERLRARITFLIFEHIGQFSGSYKAFFKFKTIIHNSAKFLATMVWLAPVGSQKTIFQWRQRREKVASKKASKFKNAIVEILKNHELSCQKVAVQAEPVAS